MNAELREAVERIKRSLHANYMPSAGVFVDVSTVEQALRDQEADIARLRGALQAIAGNGWNRKEDYCHPEGCESPGIARNALTAHLGGEHVEAAE